MLVEFLVDEEKGFINFNAGRKVVERVRKASNRIDFRSGDRVVLFFVSERLDSFEVVVNYFPREAVARISLQSRLFLSFCDRLGSSIKFVRAAWLPDLSRIDRLAR